MTEKEFEIIYNNYSNMIYHIAYSYLKNAEQARDIVQETFLKLLIHKKDFKDNSHRKYWLIRVCINLSIDQLRKNRRIILSEEWIYTIKEEENLSENYMINFLINNLPTKYRIVIILYYYENQSIKEISESLKISESAVKMRLLRGKEKLIEMRKKV